MISLMCFPSLMRFHLQVGTCKLSLAFGGIQRFVLVYSFWDDCSRDVSLMIHADPASLSPVLCVRHVATAVLHNIV